MASSWTATAKKRMLDGLFDWANDDIRVLFLRNSYGATPDYANDLLVSDVNAHELTAAGYARQALAGKTTSKDDAAKTASADANDVVMASIAQGEEIRWVVVYLHVGADNLNPILAFMEDPAKFQPAGLLTNGGEVAMRINASGLTVLQDPAP